MDPQRYKKIKEIFLKASRLKGLKRTRYLTGSCGDDIELRREIEAMLEYDDSQIDILEVNPSRSSTNVKSRFWHHTTTLTGALISRLFGTTFSAKIIVFVVATFLAVLGLWSYYAINSTLLDKISLELTTVQNGTVSSLNIWIDQQFKDTRDMASDPQIVKYTEEVLRINSENPEDYALLIRSTAYQKLKQWILTFWSQFSIGNREGIFLVNENDVFTGLRTGDKGFGLVLKALKGEEVLIPPIGIEETYIYEGNPIPSERESPGLGFLAPIKNNNGYVIAVIEKIVRTHKEFSKLMTVGFFGRTGETYMINTDAKVVTDSRYIDKLKQARLIPSNSTIEHSIGSFSLRDPGGDLLSGYKPDIPFVNWPYTKIVTEVISHLRDNPDEEGSSIILEPYRNHLGKMVIGIWRWIPDYELGVVTEIEEEEALEVLWYLESMFLLIFVVLGIATVVGLFSTTYTVRLRREVKLGQKLGQYTIIKSLGEGGLGQVYLARHAMLKRPTAIKILKSSLISAEMNQRFEREVQAASQLTHPNTIQIFDYGQTSQGIFYYVMEYVEGPTLRDLVKKEGPIVIPRVIYILEQVSASLKEAHQIGLVHRDIKPLNIMLCTRGGQSDVVKVLDFGLVKNIQDPEVTRLTKPFTFAGTALYTAPEQIKDSQNIDVHSDIYSLGAVGYYLITGQHIFDTHDDLDILYKVVNESPIPFSEEIMGKTPEGLLQLIMDCLAKDPAQRPLSISDFQQKLSSIPLKEKWVPESNDIWLENKL